MEKSRFVELAPSYYALAIAVHFVESGETYSYRASIRETFTASSTRYDPNPYNYIGNDVLFWRGVRTAEILGLIEIIPDEFGPPLYKKSEEFGDILNSLAQDKQSPFYKHQLAGSNGRSWLLTALHTVNERYKELQVESQDFNKTDQEWEPIPLDRRNEKLQEATKLLDQTIEELRSDNGYGATNIEEKNFVLEKLQSAARRLKKETQTSWMYVKEFALDPLSLLVRRFGEAAIGITAVAARTALIEWLKSVGVKVLESLFK
jgi:hypothetical protein